MIESTHNTVPDVAASDADRWAIKRELEEHRNRATGFVQALEDEFIEAGFIPATRTQRIWHGLGIAEATLDYILDSGHYHDALQTYNQGVDFVLGFRKAYPDAATDRTTREFLWESAEELKQLDDLQKEGIRQLARQIGIIDAQIKKTTSVLELVQLRKRESDLEIQIFALAVSRDERRRLPHFDQAVKRFRKEVGNENVGDSFHDLEEDTGKTHQVRGVRNETILFGLAVAANRKYFAKTLLDASRDKADNILQKRN